MMNQHYQQQQNIKHSVSKLIKPQITKLLCLVIKTAPKNKPPPNCFDKSILSSSMRPAYDAMSLRNFQKNSRTVDIVVDLIITSAA